MPSINQINQTDGLQFGFDLMIELTAWIKAALTAHSGN